MTYRKAITRVREELVERPGDPRLLLKLGELLVKVEESRAAAEVFVQVAETYYRDGAVLKATALLRHALRLAPNLTQARDRLASLYRTLGLNSEARSEYQQLLGEYAALERSDEVVRVAEAIAQLEQPDST